MMAWFLLSIERSGPINVTTDYQNHPLVKVLFQNNFDVSLPLVNRFLSWKSQRLTGEGLILTIDNRPY